MKRNFLQSNKNSKKIENFSNRNFFLNLLKRENTMKINKENYYFIKTDLSLDDVDCEIRLLKAMIDSGVPRTSSIEELAKVIWDMGYNATYNARLSFNPKDNIMTMIEKSVDTWEYNVFKYLRVTHGESVADCIEANEIQEEEDRIELEEIMTKMKNK